MRIGVDLLGIQDPAAKVRGIGRYVEQFVDRLVRSDPANEYYLYSFAGLPPLPERSAPGVRTRVVPAGDRALARAVQALVDRNPDRLDVFLVTSPFSTAGRYLPPFAPTNGLRPASLLYDLIPLLDPDSCLGKGRARRGFYFETLARLRQYGLILAISEATRRDALAHLALPAGRVVNVSSATREGFFTPPTSADLPPGLRDLGVRKPYVLGVGSADPHKNSAGLVRAFGLLPPAVRSAHQLVFAGGVAHHYDVELAALAAARGVRDRLLLTGRVSDDLLRAAYQHCAAFVFVSHYEGFGLPILEAMLSGAPVVAGDNSSQVEVAGDAGLLARTDDDADIAEKLGRVLKDPALAARLRRQGVEQARAFTWDETVRRARAAFAALPGARAQKPLLAVFAELPTGRSASLDLLEGLLWHYTVHLYHDPGDLPRARPADGRLAVFDGRLFDRHDRAWGYHAVLYLMVGAGEPAYVAEALGRRPGVVSLLRPPPGRPGARELRVLADALAVIVPDASAAARMRAALPAYAGRVHAVPAADSGRPVPRTAAGRYVGVIEGVAPAGPVAA